MCHDVKNCHFCSKFLLEVIWLINSYIDIVDNICYNFFIEKIWWLLIKALLLQCSKYVLQHTFSTHSPCERKRAGEETERVKIGNKVKKIV